MRACFASGRFAARRIPRLAEPSKRRGFSAKAAWNDFQFIRISRPSRAAVSWTPDADETRGAACRLEGFTIEASRAKNFLAGPAMITLEPLTPENALVF